MRGNSKQRPYTGFLCKVSKAFVPGSAGEEVDSERRGCHCYASPINKKFGKMGIFNIYGMLRFDLMFEEEIHDGEKGIPK